MKTHISDGNSKIGRIPNVSMTPCVSCHHDAPCRQKGQCYAIKSLMYPGVKVAWADNLDMATHHRDQYFADIGKYLDKKQPKWFRWHVAGDILDQDYLDRMVSLAKSFPDTKFACFTKMHGLDYRKTPKNLSIIFSMWPGWGTQTKDKAHSWVQDGNETRIPRTAIHCPGSCENCMMCWSLPSLKRDVYFTKH